MAKTFAQLTQEIESLKAKAHAVRQREIAGVVSRIKDAISAYGLTAQDLGFSEMRDSTRNKSVSKGAATATRGSAKKRKSGIRFRDAAGNSWTGMGPKPGWFKDAIAAGQSPESLRVPGTEKTSGPVRKKGGRAAKYRDGNGQVWSGRGPRPRWLKAAIASGKALEDFAV